MLSKGLLSFFSFYLYLLINFWIGNIFDESKVKGKIEKDMQRSPSPIPISQQPKFPPYKQHMLISCASIQRNLFI